MSDQSEWERLQQSWQTPPEKALPELARRVKRRTRTIWLMTIADLIGTPIIMGLAIWVLAHGPTPKETELAILMLILFPVAWAAVLYVRRGTWRLESAAPATMLGLLIRRCRASIILATLMELTIPLSIVVSLASRFLLGQDHQTLGLDPDTKNLLRIAIIIIVAVAVLTGAQWYKRRKRAELQQLELLQDEMGVD